MGGLGQRVVEGRLEELSSGSSTLYCSLASSFALTADKDDVYTMPPALRSFDASLKQFLAKLMRDSNDADFARRLETLEMGCLFGGKSVPARKLVGMIAHRAIRDPREADWTAERLFESTVMIGSTVDDGIAFVDKLLARLAGTREGLVSDDKNERCSRDWG